MYRSWLSLLVLLASGIFPAFSNAQVNRGAREYPALGYYLALRVMANGDYVSAEDNMRSVARLGIRTSEGPWVDSICYYTMVGDCYYWMGDLGRALAQYTNALQLYVRQSNWMLRVEFPVTVDPQSNPLRVPITWGASQRRTTAGRFSNTRYLIQQGTTNPLGTLQTGGVLAPLELYMLNAHEVARCTARALRRRAEIMGVAARHDPLTDQLIAALNVRPTQPNHWSRVWVDCMLGMAYINAGRMSDAVTELTNSLQIGGQLDHPLTGEALLALGQIAYGQQKYDQAATFFLEATFSAAWFDHYDVMAEAFQSASSAYLATRPQALYAPLSLAFDWALRQKAVALEATLLLAQAQNAAELGQPPIAVTLLEQARRTMTRAEMIRGGAGAWMSHVAALSAYQTGNLAAGDAAWANVVAYQINGKRIGSHRLFEIGLVDGLAVSGNVTPRVANELYAQVLREPVPVDWTSNPVETMTTVLLPNFAAYEHWMNVALDRDEVERAAEIADRIRRLRFYSTLPLGGRVLALTWILESPQEALPESVIPLRQDLLSRYPKYAECSRRSAELRDELRKLPLIPADAEAIRQNQKLWGELSGLSQTQELLLREIAMRREPADFVFPPPLDCKQLQKQLPPKQAVLAFLLNGQNQLHAFVISSAACRHWRIDGANRLGKQLTELLKQYGQFERNSTVDLELIASDQWKKLAAKLWSDLVNQAELDSAGAIDEFVIVPDRFVWYVPFESLLRNGESSTTPLLSEMRLRYVPTVSLAVPDRRPVSPAKDTVVVVGKMFTSDDPTDATETAAKLRKVLGEITELKTSLPVPSNLLSSLGKRTLVLHDSGDAGKSTYDWAPLQLDQDKPGSSLGQWISLPWGAPEQLVAPGYHTSAETGLRRTATGDELFLAACGLMASGCRTVLLSRWRTGGQSAFDLSREFVQELPFASAPNAWQRSVQLAWEKELRLDREPRVKAVNADAGIKATHPFFWAGYVLIDRGAVPKSDEPAKQPPPGAAKANPPAKPQPAKVEPPKAEPPEAEPPKNEPPKVEPPKAEPAKADPPKAAPRKGKAPPKTRAHRTKKIHSRSSYLSYQSYSS